MKDIDLSHRGHTRAKIALSAGIIAIVAIPLMALGRMAGLWSPVFAIPSLLAFVITVFAMITAIVLGLIGMLTRRGRAWSAEPVRRSAIALVLGIAILVPVAGFISVGAKYPPIHDISTDTDNPPKFVTLLAERAAMNAPNSTDYDPAVAAKQKVAFPDLKPKDLLLPQTEAFTRALDAAKAMGWRVAAAEPAEGRIEAVDTTFWSGFIDDIVIRVTPIGEKQSRIDVRSESRVGGGDAGKNGMRIAAYLARLN
jgi:uncharacterized protein (DUF1499 family)